MSESNGQPPIGVEPNEIWLRKRAAALAAAIERRVRSKFPVSSTTESWAAELNDVISGILAAQHPRPEPPEPELYPNPGAMDHTV